LQLANGFGPVRTIRGGGLARASSIVTAGGYRATPKRSILLLDDGAYCAVSKRVGEGPARLIYHSPLRL